MEGLIMMIIFGIIGMIFSNSNKKQEQKQKPMPPFSNKPTTKPFQTPVQSDGERKRTISSPRSLEDFAKEIFEQLNDDKKHEEVRKSPTTEIEVMEQKVQKESTQTKIEPEVTSPARVSRPTLNENRLQKPIVKDVINEKEIGSFVPTTRKALIQAIITSEIIGPPKAKQHHR